MSRASTEESQSLYAMRVMSEQMLFLARQAPPVNGKHSSSICKRCHRLAPLHKIHPPCTMLTINRAFSIDKRVLTLLLIHADCFRKWIPTPLLVIAGRHRLWPTYFFVLWANPMIALCFLCLLLHPLVYLGFLQEREAQVRWEGEG